MAQNRNDPWEGTEPEVICDWSLQLHLGQTQMLSSPLYLD